MTEQQQADLRTLAQQALTWLSSHDIQPDPINYAVAWAYCGGGQNSDLHACLDKSIVQGKHIDSHLLHDLHERFLGVDDGGLDQIGRNLQAMLKGLLQHLAEAGDGVSAFGEALTQQVSRMEREHSPEAFETVARELMSATFDAQARNQSLHQRLEETQRESERLRQELEASRQQVLTDPLTGLDNRRALDLHLFNMLPDASMQPLAMLVADIDRFKSINDSHGHAIGDVVIRNVADVLRKFTRSEDVKARFGGEEFVVLLPRTTLTGAIQVAETIRTRIEQLRLVRKQDNFRLEPFTISLGATLYQPGESSESFFERADAMLYRAKEGGRNRVVGE